MIVKSPIKVFGESLYTLLKFQNDWILARERLELESWFIESKYSFDLYLLEWQYEMLIQTPNNRPLSFGFKPLAREE